MPAGSQARLSMWPLVALHSAAVKERGEALRRARDLRRISRRELAEITGVGARTISRIETGKAGDNARSIEALEQELAPELHRITGGSDRGKTLASFTYHELLAELSHRYAELEARLQQVPTPRTTSDDEVVEWSTMDAPSGRLARESDERGTQRNQPG